MSTVTEASVNYTIPSEQEVNEAKMVSRILSPRIQGDRPLSLRILNGDDRDQETVITLPAKAAQLLLNILLNMAEGNAITIIPTYAELTTQQAADVLNVSRPFLVQLLEKNELSFRKVGTHRRVLLSDVIAYKERIELARKQSLDELAALSQDLGLEY